MAMDIRKPELVSPAGDLEKLKAAVDYGADAVYLGGKLYGLRAFAENFTLEEMEEGIFYAHSRRVKVYVTINIIPHNEDLVGLPDYLKDLARLEVDAVIVSDPGVLALVKEVVPQLKIHLSTQANNTNWRSAQFWVGQGVERIILSRELSLKEIREIREKLDIELEVFIHGAMCISYSGRCLLSNYLTYRDANRGECAHPCRWKYALMEETRPGEYFPIAEDERGAYILNSKDLCMVEHIPELISLGVDGLKIEGRVKGVNYVATVTKVYREAIDSYFKDTQNYKFNPAWLEELKKVSHREYTTGFYFSPPGPGEHRYDSSQYLQTHTLVGVVKEVLSPEKVTVEVRNRLCVGDLVEFAGPEMETFEERIESMRNVEGEELFEAHAGRIVVIRLKHPVKLHALLRRGLT